MAGESKRRNAPSYVLRLFHVFVIAQGTCGNKDFLSFSPDTETPRNDEEVNTDVHTIYFACWLCW